MQALQLHCWLKVKIWHHTLFRDASLFFSLCAKLKQFIIVCLVVVCQISKFQFWRGQREEYHYRFCRQKDLRRKKESKARCLFGLFVSSDPRLIWVFLFLRIGFLALKSWQAGSIQLWHKYKPFCESIFCSELFERTLNATLQSMRNTKLSWSVRVLALKWEQAQKNMSDNTQHPICEFQVDYPYTVA